MPSPIPFTIVVPTRDDPAKCQEMLEFLTLQDEHCKLALKVAFLVNDTATSDDSRLQKAVSNERFSSLQPRLLRATKNHSTVEENILHTLGENLDEVDEYFLIIGNSDQVQIEALAGAVDYLQYHHLDLLLVGWLNRETYQKRAIRELGLTPRQVNGKNRLKDGRSHGPVTFSDAFSDYGPEGHLSFIGCQIYTKEFFKTFCATLSSLPEPLYAIPVAMLELTTQQQCAVGFFPDITVVRIDDLRYGADIDEQPPNWWIPLSRTSRGLSRHCVLSIIANSLKLSPTAFQTLVNCQMVCNRRATPCLVFTNFLYSFVEQMRNIVNNSAGHPDWKYSAGEIKNIAEFGDRLGTVEIGLAAPQQDAVSKWFQAFRVIGDNMDPSRIRNLMISADAVLLVLDTRPGMDRWVAQLKA